MTQREEMGRRFYIDDHAVLYALIARAADAICGCQGMEAVSHGVAVYGRERGLRAAMRATADGEPLTLANYIVYGEWADPKGWSKSEVRDLQPNYRTDMTTCGWFDCWRQHDLLEYGKTYCDCVDKNLVYGFNPELRFAMGQVLSQGGDTCEFDWQDCRVDGPEAAAEMARKREALIPRVTKDFLYHCGHMLSTFRRELYLALGLVKGREIMETALREYAERFGGDKAEALQNEAKQDYLSVSP